MAPTSGEKHKGKQSKQPDEAGGAGPVKQSKKAAAKARSDHKHGFQPEDRWNMKEKERLLAGLKMFAASSLHSLARYVRTKTPEEIEAKIASIREIPVYTSQSSQKLDDESSDKTAPLEAWLPVVRDLVGQEPTDLSENLSEVIGIISRTEVPSESLSSRLNWKNVYQYISDLLADRLHLQSLTDLEALVVLDVMHAMADTLRNSDTQEQRRLLNLKYKYLRADHLCFPQFSYRDEMVTMAMRNDFSSVENETTPSSSITSPSLPSSSTADAGEGNETGTVASSSASSCDTLPGAGKSHTASVAATESSAPSSSKTSNLTDASVVSTNLKDKSVSCGSGDNVDQSAAKIPPSLAAWTPESGYSRPRYFTLNPLCIPPHLLDFNMKKT